MIIDNIASLRPLASASWDPEANNKNKLLNKDQKDALKLILYEKYVYDPLRRTRPSEFIGMEDKKYMTEDEVRGTLLNERDRDGNYLATERLTFHDQLTQYLIDKFGNKYSTSWIETNLLPAYISAVQVVEKNEWDERLKIWEREQESGVVTSNESIFGYTLGADAFDSHENFESLKEVYQSCREKIGATKEDDKTFSMRDEDFRESVKGFYNRITTVLNTERWDHNQEQDRDGRFYHPTSHKREKLIKRYARMLKSGEGGVDRYLTWNLLNMDQIYFETSGNRSQERMYGESALLAKQMVPALVHIITDGMTSFTKKIVDNVHDLEKSIKEHFGEDFKKIHAAVANIDTATSWDYCGKILMCMERMMVKDKVFRLGVIGPIAGGLYRRVAEGQQSFMTSKIPVTDSEGATDLDSTGAFVFYRVLGDAIDMPREKEQVVDYEAPKFLGKPLKGFWARVIPGKPIHAHGKKVVVSIQHLIENSKVTTKNRIVEQLPMIGPIFLIIMAMLIKISF